MKIHRLLILISIVSLIKFSGLAQEPKLNIASGLFEEPIISDSISCQTGYVKLVLPDGKGHSTNYVEGFNFRGRRVGVWCKRNVQHKIISLTVYHDTTSERMSFFEYNISNGMLKECGDYLMEKFAVPDTLSIAQLEENHPKYFLVEGEYKKTGIWSYFHENGNLYSRGQYRNGEKTGEWKFYSLAGELIETKKY